MLQVSLVFLPSYTPLSISSLLKNIANSSFMIICLMRILSAHYVHLYKKEVFLVRVLGDWVLCRCLLALFVSVLYARNCCITVKLLIRVSGRETGHRDFYVGSNVYCVGRPSQPGLGPTCSGACSCIQLSTFSQ